METLAYLHLAQDNEASEVKELSLDAGKISAQAAVGALGIAAAAIGAFGTADSASAQYYCYEYDPCDASYYYPDYGYYPVYDYSYYYPDYNYYPVYDYSYYYPDYSYYYPDYSYYYPSYDYYPVYDYSYYYPVNDPCYYPVNPCGGSGGGYLPINPGVGSYGAYDIQIALNNAGFPVVVDGVYGPQTSNAVAAFQAYYGLLVDGVVGPQTASYLGLL